MKSRACPNESLSEPIFRLLHDDDDHFLPLDALLRRCFTPFILHAMLGIQAW